jgi:hypothetical protein
MASSPITTLITRRDSWQSVWRYASGDALLAASLIGLAALLAIAALLPQSPQGDPASYARWLSDAQLRFGGAFGFISALGLFDVVHSAVFRALAGLLGFALFARLIDHGQELRAASTPAAPPDSPARTLEVELAPEALARRLRRYRLRTTDTFTLADRFPWAHTGAIAAHAGPLVLLIGLALSPLTDWRIDTLDAIPGVAQPLRNTPYHLQVSDVDSGGDAHLTLLQDGAPVAQGRAAPGRPWLAADLSVFVRDLLPALRVTGRDAGGNALDLQVNAQSPAQKEVLLTFNSDRPDAFLAAPNAQPAVRVSWIGPDGERAYRVSVFSGARLIADEAIRPGQVIDAQGHRFEFVDASHAVVSVVRAPAQIVIGAGLIVTLAGLACVALYPARRVWLVAHGSGARVSSDDADFDLALLAAKGNRR